MVTVRQEGQEVHGENGAPSWRNHHGPERQHTRGCRTAHASAGCRGELRRDRVRRLEHGCQTDTNLTGPAAAEVLAAFRPVQFGGRDYG